MSDLCKRGHELAADNLLIQCRECRLIVARRRKNVRDWGAVIDVCDLAKLVRRDALNQSSNLHCRLTLAQLVELLTLAGWASTN